MLSHQVFTHHTSYSITAQHLIISAESLKLVNNVISLAGNRYKKSIFASETETVYCNEKDIYCACTYLWVDEHPSPAPTNTPDTGSGGV